VVCLGNTAELVADAERHLQIYMMVTGLLIAMLDV